MLIVGAKGFAKEVLEIQHQLNDLKNLVFFDDINVYPNSKIFDTFSVLKTYDEASNYFKTVDSKFTIGIGNPVLRKKMHDTFLGLGGVLSSTISSNTNIGHYGVHIEDGCNILDGAIISNDVSIGKCVIVYYNCVITHDVSIGDFVEISPGATLLGRCSIGDYSQIGSNATILPDVTIGKNVLVGAGAVVTKDVPDNSVITGIPGKVIKTNEPLTF